MKKIQYELLVKFLKLFIKNSDLQEQDEKQLFNSLKIIKENPVPEE